MLSRSQRLLTAPFTRSISVASIPGPPKKHYVRDWKKVELQRAHAKRHGTALYIQKKMKKLKTTASVLKFYKEQKNIYADHMNYAGTLFLLGRKRWNIHNGKDAFDTFRLDNIRLADLANTSAGFADKWRPRELSNVSWALGRILSGDHPSINDKSKAALLNLASIVADLSIKKMPLFNGTDVCEAVRGMADACPDNTEFFDAVEAQMKVHTEEMIPLGLADTAVGFSLVGRREPVQLIADELQRRFDDESVVEFMYTFDESRTHLKRLEQAASAVDVTLPAFLERSEVAIVDEE